MTGKYGNLLKKARGENGEAENNNESALPNTAKQKVVKPALQLDVNTEETSETEIQKEKDVSLTIKVPKKWRQHWVAECKREGKTLKEVVTEMLAEKGSNAKKLAGDRQHSRAIAKRRKSLNNPMIAAIFNCFNF